MEDIENNYSLVLKAYGETPVWEKYKVEDPTEDEVLVKVEASTINPADYSIIETGFYAKQSLPSSSGYEGVGRVVKTGKNTTHLDQKRVCFSKMPEEKNNVGAWSNYTTVHKLSLFVIDEDVPVQSAASGIINPLTVIGIFSVIRKLGLNGIVQTAASSALGRMVNRLCMKQNIPIINVVRRSEHYDLLKNDGAEHVIVTTGDWETSLKELISKLKIKVFLDALGGGEVQAKIIQMIKNGGTMIIYGILDAKQKMQISGPEIIFGLSITGFFLYSWLPTISQQQRDEIAKKYSNYLKNELASTTGKQFKFSQIAEAIAYNKANPSKGKVLLRP